MAFQIQFYEVEWLSKEWVLPWVNKCTDLQNSKYYPLTLFRIIHSKTNQPTDQSAKLTANQPPNQQPTNQPTSQPTNNQPTNHPTNHPTNQPTNN